MRKLLSGPIVAVLAAASCPVAALERAAQDEKGPDGRASSAPVPSAVMTEQAGDIIVTAQRRSESIQQVPVTVNAFDQAAVQERRITDLTDLAVQAPGLRFSEFANAGNVSIRVVGTAFVSGSGESSVGIYVDGVSVLQSKALGLGQFDIGGIEVLRGPQWTLYGRNSTAGVINFSSAAPTRNLSSGFVIGAGNYGSVRANAFISGPVSDDVRVRVFLEKEYRDGFVVNALTGQRPVGVPGGLCLEDARYARRLGHGGGDLQLRDDDAASQNGRAAGYRLRQSVGAGGGHRGRRPLSDHG